MGSEEANIRDQSNANPKLLLKAALAAFLAVGAAALLGTATASSGARFYTLRSPVKERLGTPEVLDLTTLKDASDESFTASDFDGEGLALGPRLPGGRRVVALGVENGRLR